MKSPVRFFVFQCIFILVSKFRRFGDSGEVSSPAIGYGESGREVRRDPRPVLAEGGLIG